MDSSDTGITDHCSVLAVAIERVEPLETKGSSYEAYKLTVSASDKDKLLDARSLALSEYVRNICQNMSENSLRRKLIDGIQNV